MWWIAVIAVLVLASALVVAGRKYRRLSSRCKQLEADAAASPETTAANARRERRKTPPDLSPPLDVRPHADIGAPGDFLVHGLNACGFTPFHDWDRNSRHFVILVLQLTNRGESKVALRTPYLTFNIGAGATKLEPPATLAALERLSFFDLSGPAPRLLDNVKEKLLGRVETSRSLNRPTVELEPHKSQLVYAVFTPAGLDSLPVFAGGSLKFGISFLVNGTGRRYDDFRAWPLRRLGIRAQ